MTLARDWSSEDGTTWPSIKKHIGITPVRLVLSTPDD